MTPRPRLLVLGAGVYQVPLIETAKRIGLETVVASVEGAYPGIALADRFLAIDTTDVEAIVAAAREQAIDGVVTTGTDAACPALGAVSDRLGLPGVGFEVACRCANKAHMKQTLARRGIPTAPFALASSLRAARSSAEALGYPVMLKPIDASGSRGISRVPDPEGLVAAWQDARAVTRSQTVLIESALDGLEFGAQVFVEAGAVTSLFLHNDRVTPPPRPTPVGHSLPSVLPGDTQRDSAEWIGRTVEAMEIRDAVCNFDLILVEGQPMVIEVGARAGATGLPECVSVFAGFDVYERIIRAALGESFGAPRVCERPTASLLLRSAKTGVVTRVEVPGAVRHDPHLRELRIDVAPGDRVRAFVTGPERIGHLVVSGDSAHDAERRAELLADGVTIEVREER